MSMHEYGTHGLSYVLKGEELKSVLTKLYPEEVKDDPECLDDEDWIYDAACDSCQLDYISAFTGSGVCINDDGTCDFGTESYYSDESLITIPLDNGNVFRPMFTSIQEIRDYLHDNWDIANPDMDNLQFIRGTVWG